MPNEQITDAERTRLMIQADRLVEILATRYGVDPHEVVDAVKWVQEHKEWAGKMRSAGSIGLVTLLVSALMVSLWEGFKALLGRHP
jgi:hypothetical protein